MLDERLLPSVFMNNFFRPFLGAVARSLYALALGAPLCIPGAASGTTMNLGSADRSDLPQAFPPECESGFLAPIEEYDTGRQTSVAAHPSGLVVEVHRTEVTSHGFYHIGKRDPITVRWGGSQHAGFVAHWPTIALTKDGYVLLVFGNKAGKDGSDLFYRVGKIDPEGDENQSITWVTDPMSWDRGFHSSIAINDNGVIVAVHETGHASSGLYYRIGHFRNPAGGDFTVDWDSGEWGIQYDDGINPDIAINNLNEIVAVHQVPGESLLHYRRGIVNGGVIEFGESRRYDNYADRPSVVLFDSGEVREVHTKGGFISRQGSLSAYDPAAIEWDEPVVIDGNDDLAYTSLATDGTRYLIATVDIQPLLLPIQNAIRYTVADVCPPWSYPNGTLIRGSGPEAYVVLDNYRYWIPNEATFYALGYRASNIRVLSDDYLNVIPEGDALPSVAPPPLFGGPLRYPNGTLVQSKSSPDVYVVLNNSRHRIPDPATFEAMNYNWSNIRLLDGNQLDYIPERAPFPSVVR